jgi:hypothetical protein
MRTFIFQVHDDRWSEATVVAAIVSDETRARALAKQQLEESRHRWAVHVREGRRLLFSIVRDQGTPTAA